MALDNILRHLTYPCRYQGNGCKERTDQLDYLLKHQEKCIFRDYTCPIFYIGDCKWRGHISLLLKHFEDYHPKNVKQEGRDNCVDLKIEVEEYCVTGVLLLTKFEKFFLQYKSDGGKVYYRVFVLGDREQAAGFHCVIEQKDCVNGAIKFETHLPVLPDTEFSTAFNGDTTTSFDFQQIMNGKNCFVSSVRVIPANPESEKFDRKLLRHFECPVCTAFMKPPIFQCLAGHSICNNCRPKLPHCPTCRANYGMTRNYTLEGICNGTYYVCSYRESGCTAVMLGASMSKHEMECPLRPFVCPLKENESCSWEGIHSSIANHLKERHCEKVKFTNYLRTTHLFSFDRRQHDVYCMVAFGEIFKVGFRYDIGEQNGYWSVQMVGSKENAKGFRYEIGLIDPKNEDRMLIRTDLCHEITNLSNISTNCAIPVSIISGFAAGGHMIYFCRITKRADRAERC